jgi:hypothetical protein
MAKERWKVLPAGRIGCWKASGITEGSGGVPPRWCRIGDSQERREANAGRREVWIAGIRACHPNPTQREAVAGLVSEDHCAVLPLAIGDARPSA